MFFRNYQYSIWIDGNVIFYKNPLEYIHNNKFDYILIPKHPQRDCIYDEGNICIKWRKDTKENVNPLLKFLTNENYPKHYGLVQSNIILRKHNDPNCIKLMESWWNIIKNFSKRDQLSFNYCCWKLNLIPDIINWKSIENKYIHWNGHHKK